jgi:hypothetical protein
MDSSQRLHDPPMQKDVRFIRAYVLLRFQREQLIESTSIRAMRNKSQRADIPLNISY